MLAAWAAVLACAVCCWSSPHVSTEDDLEAGLELTLMSTSLMLPLRSPSVTTLHQPQTISASF